MQASRYIVLIVVGLLVVVGGTPVVAQSVDVGGRAYVVSTGADNQNLSIQPADTLGLAVYPDSATSDDLGEYSTPGRQP